ncbi:hypothetical protein ACWA06_02970 [Serratia rhizosphaerae]|uniref:hypothetical protein n=1 Tax=unclassified Serratia (in: enterobacteria) TaxID=2647522 RepID=UPI000CF6E43C|nr:MULTISPECIES: hypothetical protein [unclassified Serratia (in: enterobacteria)]AVJ17378.1 hypothetical protein CLM71_09610 [Serratia sp. MYb239]MBU3891172.1 hypothetical protein [Serratia rubidaea]MCA4822203.1 hypothetical protein [Serratia rubidaea]CAE1145445.1 conserved protein of unknown function [Serratia sp. Tan611]
MPDDNDRRAGQTKETHIASLSLADKSIFTAKHKENNWKKSDKTHGHNGLEEYIYDVKQRFYTISGRDIRCFCRHWLHPLA